MNETASFPGRYCIIGAGASGLAVAKTFAQRGIPFDCFEAEADVGGIWNPDSPHAVYDRTFLNSSKSLTRYTDFPMPADDPVYLSRRQAVDYLRDYAREFGLYDRITFSAAVDKVERVGEGDWRVTVRGERGPRTYAGVVVANGHHWEPKSPEPPGRFAGEVLHSHDVKSRDVLKDKRVLVVGAGNSGADIASDAATESIAAYHSMRRGYHFVPKLVFGRPTDVLIDRMSRWPLPRAVMRAIYRAGLGVLIGPIERYGLPRPDHDLFEAHPTVVSNYLNHIAHGRIAIKPGIERLEGDKVRFSDGSEEPVDLIVYATGYRPSFPFLDPGLFLTGEGRPHLFLSIFHRELDDLFAVGLIEPAEGGMWQLADYQAQLVASFIVAQARDPKKAAWFRRLKATARPDVGHGIRAGDTDWHKFEIQHYRYRMFIRKLLARFGPMATASLAEPAPTSVARLAT